MSIAGTGPIVPTCARFDPGSSTALRLSDVGDGTAMHKVAVEYRSGHRRRHEGIPLLEEKFRRSLARRFPKERREAILALLPGPGAPGSDAGQRVRRSIRNLKDHARCPLPMTPAIA